jgi:hypothetical protein
MDALNSRWVITSGRTCKGAVTQPKRQRRAATLLVTFYRNPTSSRSSTPTKTPHAAWQRRSACILRKTIAVERSVYGAPL